MKSYGPFSIIILFVVFFSAGIPCNAQNPAMTHSYGDTSIADFFGMRIREKPSSLSNVFAPVVLHPSPGNEATIMALGNNAFRIFYINTPDEANVLRSITSIDGGKTWGASIREFDFPGNANFGHQVIIDEKKNLHTIFHIYGSLDSGVRSSHLDIWYNRKKAGEAKWEKPRKIYDGWVGAIRNLMLLKNGRIVGSFAKRIPSRHNAPPPGETDYGRNETISIYSDDKGETWKTSVNSLKIEVDPSMPSRYGAIEPNVIEMNDGKLWMLIRTNKGRLYESRSLDGGVTWEEAKPSRFISSDSPAGLLRLSDGRILLLLNSNQRWNDKRSYAAGGREMLHAAISKDEGKTWQGFREVLSVPPARITARGDRGAAYPSASETPNGKVLIVSGQGASRSIVALDPDWLEQEKVEDKFSSGLVQWTLYDADSLIRLNDDKPKGLLLRKSNTNRGNAEAVWNFPSTSRGKLTLKLRRNNDARQLRIALSDHFAVSCDSLASDNGIVSFILDWKMNPGLAGTSTDSEIEVEWNTGDNMAMISINGKILEKKTVQRVPDFGPNYLRIGIPGNEPEHAGFILREIKMKKK